MNDEEENEDGLDADLEGFVDRAPLEGDAEEILAGNDAAHEAYQKQMAEDEKAMNKQIMSAVFLGNNKKRKRGDVEDFEDLDEAQKRKIRELERRAEALSGDECEDAGNEIEMQIKMKEL